MKPRPKRLHKNSGRKPEVCSEQRMRFRLARGQEPPAGILFAAWVVEAVVPHSFVEVLGGGFDAVF